jgi:hypothetical protein
MGVRFGFVVVVLINYMCSGRKMLASSLALESPPKAHLATMSAAKTASSPTRKSRIADEQGLTPGIHPGFSRMGRRQKRSR